MDFGDFSLNVGALKKAKQPDVGKTYDLLILGGGPASMSAAVYAARKMLEIAIITKDFGGQVNETSEVENWLGAQSVNAKDLAAKFTEHVQSFDLPVSMGPGVTKVAKDNDLFTVTTDQGKAYTAKAILMSTGARHRQLNVPGEKALVGKGVAYCATCDAPFFKNKKVAIAGGGNSAHTTALDLLKVDAEVTMINLSRRWQGDDSLQEKLRRHEKIRFLTGTEIISVEGQDRVTGVVVKDRDGGEPETVPADGLFVEIGLIPNSDPVKDLAKLNDRGEVLVDCACSTNVDGLVAAGDVTSVPYKQIVISAGEGAKAALAAYDYLMEKDLI